MAYTNVQRVGGFAGDGLPPLPSLVAATAPRVGLAYSLGSAVNNFTAQITTTGSPASFSVTLEVSNNGTTWVAAGAAITAVGLTTFAGVGAAYARLNLTALTGGTAPTVTGLICGV